MNISLPDTMKSFVETQVSERGYGTSSEFIRELIRKEQDRADLRAKILAGLASPAVNKSVDEVFQELDSRIDSLDNE